MSTSSHSLYQSVRDFDRLLARPVLNALGLNGVRQALEVIERFYHQAPHHPQPDTLLAAGCRLSCDLNQALVDKLVDNIQSQDAHIAELSSQLRQKLHERHQAAQLLKQAQALHQQTLNTAHIAGLGCIL